MEKRPPPEREREGEVAKESRGVSQVPRSVAGRARVGRPVNVLNFQNRREKPRAAEFPHTPRRTKGIPARRRHGQAPSTPVPSPLFRLALGSPGMLSAGAMRRGAPPPPSGLALIIAGERDCGGAGQGWVPGVGLAVAPQAGPTWGRWVGCAPTGTARSRARGDSAHGKAPSSPSWQSGSFTAHAPTGTCFLQGPNLLEKP